MANGILIALEGIDGSGTTSQGQSLAEHLRHNGHDVHLTAEPSELPIGRLIRRVLHGELTMSDSSLALLFAADRLDHVRQEIQPALDRGALVLSDRYLLSSLAYQATGSPLSWVRELNREARRPELSILLRVSAETAARRRDIRGGEPERFDALERQQRIVAAYEEAFELDDVGPTTVIDAEQSFDEVARALRELVEPLVSA